MTKTTQRDTFRIARMRKLSPYIDAIAETCHESSQAAGWYQDLTDVIDAIAGHNEPDEMERARLCDLVENWFMATKIALIHSEVSEMMEGLRKGNNDDHLPNRPMFDVEAADVLIRLADLCGARNVQLGESTSEKFEYNITRKDHQQTARNNEGGKKF